MTTTVSERFMRLPARTRTFLAANLEQCLSRNGSSLTDGDRVLIASMRSDTPAMTTKEAKIVASWNKVVANLNQRNFPTPYRGGQ